MRLIIGLFMAAALIRPCAVMAIENPPSVQDVLQGYKGPQQISSLWLTYVAGILHGLGYTNALQVKTGKPPIYCPPDEQQIGPQHVIEAVEALTQKTPKIRETSFGAAAIFAMTANYPCK